MNPTFKPPRDEAEFAARANELSLVGAQQLLRSLKKRRETTVKSIDEEIAFYEKVVTHKEAQA